MKLIQTDSAPPTLTHIASRCRECPFSYETVCKLYRKPLKLRPDERRPTWCGVAAVHIVLRTMDSRILVTPEDIDEGH